MSDFILGPIKIVDDGDGIYEAPLENGTAIDEIQDLNGKTVGLQGKDAQDALKLLGIKSFSGLRLSPASLYLSLFDRARGLAAAGNTLQTQDTLRDARHAARAGRLPFAEQRAEGILNIALKEKLDRLMTEAPLLSDQGKIAALQDTLNAARDVLMRLGVLPEQAADKGLPYSPFLADQLEKKAYQRAMPPLWVEAEASAKAGNVFKTTETLRLYREYADRGFLGLSQDQEKAISKLIRLAHREAVQLFFNQAKTVAATGDVEKTRSLLSEAREAARLGGKPMTKRQASRAKKIEKIALQNSPTFLFALAQGSAQAGDVAETRRLIQQAVDFRRESGSDLSSKQRKSAEQLEKTALLASVDLLLKRAKAGVAEVSLKGDMNPVRDLVQSARDNAQLAGSSLDVNQEKLAKDILDLAANAAVQWRFGQAKRAAFLGKVDDTIVPLNAAREFAKQHGLAFDESLVTNLVNTALARGIELSFTAAEAFATAGDADNTFFQLDNARDYARRLKQAFDEARAKEILKLLR